MISVTDTKDPPETLITTQLASVTDTISPDAGNTLQFFAGKDNAFALSPYAITEGHLIRRDRELVQLNTSDHVFYKVISLIENTVNYTDWAVPTLNIFSGQGAVDANYDLSGDGKLFIPANSLITSDGNPYVGSYTLHWALFNPSNEESRFIPSYSAISKENQIVQVLPQFCLYVTVKADDGSTLKFSSGAYIASNISNEASWFFDDEAAAWLPQGTESRIDLVDNGYYMVGQSVNQTRVTGTLQINGLPAPHYAIRINYEGFQRNLFTTNNGTWSIVLPSGESCVASVSLPCGSDQQIPFDVSDGPSSTLPIAIQESGVINAFIKGTVRGCEAEVIADPMLIVRGAAAQFYYPSNDGISLYYPSCVGSVLEVQAIHQDSQESGPVISWKSADTVDIRSAFACNAARNEYLFLNVAGDQKMYWDMNSAYTTQDRVLIETGGNEPDVEFKIYISGDMEGDYEDTDLNILFEDMQLGTRGFSLNCPSATSGCGFTDFSITHFPNQSGQWIRGYFQGKFWIKTFYPLTAGYRDVSGEFQVYREF